RDPRQYLLSLIHHVDRYRIDFPFISEHEMYRGPIAEQIDRLLAQYIAGVFWIQRWIAAESEIEVLFSTFEDFVKDRDAFIERYLEFYGGPREHFSYENAVTEHAGTDYHFRSGQTDEWRSVFPAEQAKLLSKILPDDLKQRFGWPD